MALWYAGSKGSSIALIISEACYVATSVIHSWGAMLLWNNLKSKTQTYAYSWWQLKLIRFAWFWN
jgi:hypothetical protein